MARGWQKVPIEQARQHPLYGVGGWLIVFSVGLLLGLFKELGAVSGEANTAGMTLSDLFAVDHPAVTFLKLAFGLHTLVIVVIYWLLFSKHASFRKVASALLLAAWPAVALIGLIYPFPGLGADLASGFILWIVSCAVWVTYLQRSKRVRVTFEHCLPIEQSGGAARGESLAVSVNALTAPAVARGTATCQSRTAPAEEYWATALAEFEGALRRPGLWARVFAEGQGNEQGAKAAYLQFRAAELEHEHQLLIVEQERQARLVAREAQLQGLTAEERAYELLPKGRCPNPHCESVMPLLQTTCEKCGAMFGGSGWNLIPIKEA
jgi:hypothetical protein